MGVPTRADNPHLAIAGRWAAGPSIPPVDTPPVSTNAMAKWRSLKKAKKWRNTYCTFFWDFLRWSMVIYGDLCFLWIYNFWWFWGRRWTLQLGGDFKHPLKQRHFSGDPMWRKAQFIAATSVLISSSGAKLRHVGAVDGIVMGLMNDTMAMDRILIGLYVVEFMMRLWVIPSGYVKITIENTTLK